MTRKPTHKIPADILRRQKTLRGMQRYLDEIQHDIKIDRHELAEQISPLNIPDRVVFKDFPNKVFQVVLVTDDLMFRDEKNGSWLVSLSQVDENGDFGGIQRIITENSGGKWKKIIEDADGRPEEVEG